MFDVAPTEFLLVAVIALIVIGPKDLPKAMRVVGYWVGRMRGVARQFRSGFDTMVREAELEEMEKRWAAENERIMREHAATEGSVPVLEGEDEPKVTEAPVIAATPAHEPGYAAGEPIRVEEPVVRPTPNKSALPRGDGVTS
ncbi:Sec-independent protein translocase protein TatB [uncultured Sphingomonas sp.]|uniref:Sec-independent protein translocase protein TatB n=1 Tax=uncultured Sphingomonas sp. TaxID=158754 RepID=UPI0035CA1146